MNENNSSSLLANVTFEDIMSEEVISSTETKRTNTSSRNSIKFSIVKNLVDCKIKLDRKNP